MSLDSNRNKSSSTYYFEFGQNEQLSGDITTDRHRANTKVEDETNLLNEGKRFRHLELDVFLTPDPLEYVDGFNPYIYCNQNPWGKWDPLGLREETKEEKKNIKKMREFIKKNFSETKKNSKGKEVSTLTDEGSKMMHAVDMLQNDIKSVKDGEKDPANLAAALYAISKWATDSKEFTKAARTESNKSSDGTGVVPFGEDKWKCNRFVADSYVSADGADVGLSDSGYPGTIANKKRKWYEVPSANSLARKKQKNMSSPKPIGDAKDVLTGDIISHPSNYGSGHTGIAVGNGIFISAGRTGINLEPLTDRASSTYIRYEGK